MALPRVLVADDQPDVLEALRLLLAPNDLSLSLVTSPAAVVEQLRAQSWDLLLMDLNYTRDTTSGDEGMQLLAQVREIDRVLPVVVMTAWGNINLAVEAMRAGAQSFVQKPWDNAALLRVVQREIADGRAARERSVSHEREQHEALLIQRALMPATLPSTDAIQVAGTWRPALGFGGDCYDAITFGHDAMALSIADVAGKGLPAALLMSSLQAAIRAFALEASPPQNICGSVNRLLCGQMIAGRFVTLFYVRLDRTKGTIHYANAGHNPPLLARRDGEVIRLHAGGTVLGVFPDAAFGAGELSLQSGDRLLLYTDGITEARNDADEEYGEQRLNDALRTHRHLPAQELHAKVWNEVETFASAGFQDDATLLAVAIS